MTSPEETLLLCGASVRAAAWSARRAGFRSVLAIDLFADADLALNCETRRVESDAYPEGLATASEGVARGPVVYTGALENYPRVVERLSRQRRLWGNGPEVLRAARDPFLVTKLLSDAGLPAPRVVTETLGNDVPGWLVKRRRSGGGFGIHPWAGEPVAEASFLQEYIPGLPYAAIFCGYAANHCILLGVTRQLVGEPWLHASPFHYCGSVGPVNIGAGTRTLERIGMTLVNGLGLRGLFGIDFILKHGEPYLVEVNPRYTASVEILERATGVMSFLHQQAAFEARPVPFVQATRDDCWGKVILFADRNIAFPEDGSWLGSLKTWSEQAVPDFADIPHPGATILQGQPIFTLFARGHTVDDCLVKLREKVAETKCWLYP